MKTRGTSPTFLILRRAPRSATPLSKRLLSCRSLKPLSSKPTEPPESRSPCRNIGQRFTKCKRMRKASDESRRARHHQQTIRRQRSPRPRAQGHILGPQRVANPDYSPHRFTEIDRDTFTNQMCDRFRQAFFEQGVSCLIHKMERRFLVFLCGSVIDVAKSCVEVYQPAMFGMDGHAWPGHF